MAVENVNSKPIAASAAIVDFILASIGGKVRRVPISTLAETLTDAEVALISAAASALVSAAGKACYIGDNENWYVWDGTQGAFIDSGFPSRGTQGNPGVIFTPHLTDAGVLSWTNDGGLSNPATVNIKGPKGDQGEKGATGATGPQGPAGPVNVPSTTKPIKGDGSGGLAAATPETDYASPVFMRKVTLVTTGAWSWNYNNKQQSVTVPGVLADTTKQCIYTAPVDTSYDSAWNSCGVLCVAQAANSLTFQCSEIPTSNIEVYVTVITLSYKG